VSFSVGDDKRLHPGRSAVVTAGMKPIGIVGEVHPRLAADLNVRNRVIYFELDVDALKSEEERRSGFVQLTPYPAVIRDLAPRISADLPYSRIDAAINVASIAIMQGFELTDVFSGSPLPNDVKSLTLSFTFRSPDRTLTDEEVNDALARLRASLET